MKKYYCWLSHTCYVCSGGGKTKPGIHVREKEKYEMVSSCDSTPVVISADSRKQALVLFKQTTLFKNLYFDR